MSDVATRGRRVDQQHETRTSTETPRARRTSGPRHLTPSEFAELFPVHSATWERRRDQTDGEFVQTYRRWDWWLTLTFKDIVSGTFALSLLKEWARGLAKDLRTHIDLAIGMELQARGAPHFHVLLRLHQHAEDFDPKRAARCWRDLSKRCGTKNKVEAFDPDKAGGEYLTKQGAWGFLVACPRWSACRRRHGCIVDRYAW